MSTDNLHTVDKIIQEIKKRKGFTEDKELADWLSISNKVLSAWKSRKKIADFGAFSRQGISVDWLRTGEGEMFISEEEKKNADYNLIVQAIIGKVSPLTEVQQVEALKLLAEAFPGDNRKEKP
jgi:hypothetical protein